MGSLEFFDPKAFEPENTEVLNGVRPVTASDFQRTLNPDNNANDYDYLQSYLAPLSLEDQKVLTKPYLLRLNELWQLTAQSKQSWPEYMQQAMENGVYQWVVDRNNIPRLTLPEEQYDRVLTSRCFPLVSQDEMKQLSEAKIACFGTSTSLPILAGLAQIGAKHFEVIDPDLVNSSNNSRLYGSSDQRVGMAKVVHAGEILTGINPYIKFTGHQKIMSEDEIRDVFGRADIVLEMTDGGKVLIRRVQKELAGLGENPAAVVMATNIGWQPITSVETGDAPMFLRNMPEEYLQALEDPGSNPQMAMQALAEVVGTKNAPTRQVINLILNAMPEYRYLAQHGPNAFGAAFGAIRAILNEVCGYPQKKEVVLNIDSLLGVADAGNDQLLRELGEIFPVFQQFSSLDEAAQKLAKLFFDIDWSPTHN